MKKIIFIPGNGGGTPHDNWFPYLAKELANLKLEIVAKDFPDSDMARAIYWLPFLKDTLKADNQSILIGHSSGAIAAMRYAEKEQILGSVLVGAYYTDLHDEKEKASGYFDHFWNWEAIKKNQQWVIQFASVDDPWIPITEPRHIHEMLTTEYYEYVDQGHFGGDNKKTEFPEIVAVLQKKLTE